MPVFLSQSLTTLIASAFDNPLSPFQDDTEKRVCSCSNIYINLKQLFLIDWMAW